MPTMSWLSVAGGTEVGRWGFEYRADWTDWKWRQLDIRFFGRRRKANRIALVIVTCFIFSGVLIDCRPFKVSDRNKRQNHPLNKEAR
jgi:hypothetical protein